MKINFETIREKIETYDKIAQADMSQPYSIFPQKQDLSVKERMQRFFEVADGENPSWNV